MLYENYIDRMKNYHDLKESIGIDVVNLSDNILYLKDKCYTSFLDLAIVYYIAPNSHQKFWLPKNVFKKWSITPELLRKQALENIHKTSQFALKYYPFLSLHDTCEKSKNIVALVDTQLLNSKSATTTSSGGLLLALIRALYCSPKRAVSQALLLVRL